LDTVRGGWGREQPVVFKFCTQITWGTQKRAKERWDSRIGKGWAKIQANGARDESAMGKEENPLLLWEKLAWTFNLRVGGAQD